MILIAITSAILSIYIFLFIKRYVNIREADKEITRMEFDRLIAECQDMSKAIKALEFEAEKTYHRQNNEVTVAETDCESEPARKCPSCGAPITRENSGKYCEYCGTILR